MQEAIKIMIRDKVKGTIAHVLSIAAYSGMPFLAAYSPSKGALAIMIKNVANAVAANQIRINGLNIGWTDTPGENTTQKMIEMFRMGFTSREVAKILNRGTQSVAGKRSSLYKKGLIPISKKTTRNRRCLTNKQI